MKRLLCLLLIFLLLPTGLCTAEEKDDILRTNLDAIMKKYGVPGSQVAIVRGGEVIFTYNWGVTNRQKDPVTDETYFRTASITKMVSAMGVMQLVESGKLELDRDLSDYYGFPVGNGRFKKTKVTLRQVMSHTSSLTGEHDFSTSHDMEWQLTNQKTYNWENWEPGTSYMYSNMNGGLLGNLVELITGQTLNDYMHEHYFDPLNIDAGFGANQVQHPELISARFNSEGTVHQAVSYLLREDPYKDLTWNPSYNMTVSVGSLYIHAPDLAKLVYILCRDGTVEGQRFLSEDTVKLMRQNQGEIDGSSVKTKRSAYGLNVDISVEDMTPVKWYGHQGSLSGIFCNAYFSPKLDSVVVFLSNGSRSKKVGGVGTVSRKVMDEAYAYLVPNEF